MQEINSIFYVVILIFSVVIHEVAHGYAADYFGDPTARLAGRLTMNPIKHIDLWGSIIIPLLLVLSGTTFLVGWAKPVPYNPNHFDNKKKGTIVTALAGVCANFFIAIIFGLAMRFVPAFGLGMPAHMVVSTIVVVNIVLGLFNLIPIVPLDGSKVLFELIPLRAQKFRYFWEKNSLIILIVFIFFFWAGIAIPTISFLYRLLTGTFL